MNWYAIDITESCMLGGAYHKLCRDFQHAFIAAGAPPEMALMAQRMRVDAARRVYISPESLPYVGELVEAYGGRPCSRPNVEEVTLVYGVPGAKDRLLVRADYGLEVYARDAAAASRDAHIVPMLPVRQAASG